MNLQTNIVYKNRDLKFYYSDMACEKVEERVDTLLQIIELQRQGKHEQAEFLENMKYKPLGKQIKYLANKSVSIPWD